MTFQASRPHTTSHTTRRARCARCGFERANGTNTTTLCRMCTSVMTPHEKALWNT